MQLNKKDIEHLHYLKNASLSKDYILFSTGTRVIVCNKDLKCLHVFEQLKNVYSVYISPDQTKALFVSEKPVYYIADLISYSIERKNILPPYNDNIEGLGCWDQNSKSVFIPVQNKTTMCSIVRQYFIGDTNLYKDVFTGHYHVTSVQYIEPLKKLLFVGLDLEKYFNFSAECWFMAWHDNDRTVIIYLKGNRTNVEKTEIKTNDKIIRVFSDDKISEYGFDGQVLSQVSVQDYYMEKAKLLHPLFINERIYKIVSVDTGDYCLVGTDKALALVNIAQKTITKRIPSEFGVYDIRVLENNTVLYATGSGIRFAQIL